MSYFFWKKHPNLGIAHKWKPVMLRNFYFSSNFDVVQVVFQRISFISYGFRVKLNCTKTGTGGSPCRLDEVVLLYRRCRLLFLDQKM